MAEGLFVFTSHRVEKKVMECMGFSPLVNQSRIENGYLIQKYHVKGGLFYETVIRVADVLGRAKKLQEKLGNVNVFVISPNRTIHPHSHIGHNIKVISSISDMASVFQTALTPAECNGLQEVFSQHRPTTLRNMENPETMGDTEMEFSNQFFSAVRAGRHMPAPDQDMFRGAVIFTPNTNRITIVHTSSDEEDTQLRMAIEMSMNHPQPIQERGGGWGEESPEKRRRTIAPSWLSVLKDPEPKVVGYPICITCTLHRASVCFVDCGHQVMCDECVRQMCELPNVRKACPYCRCESESILRPIISEIEK